MIRKREVFSKKGEIIAKLSKPDEWISSKKDSPLKHQEFFIEVENTKFSKISFIVRFPDKKIYEVSFMCTKEGNWFCYLWDKPIFLPLDFDSWIPGSDFK